MRKVIINRDTPLDATHFHAAFDVFKTGEGIKPLIQRHASVTRGEHGGQRIHAVMLTGQRPGNFADHGITLTHGHAAGGVVTIDRKAPLDTEANHGCPATAFQNTVKCGLGGIRDDQAVARHGAHQMVELGFDGGEIGKNIGVVEFKVVEDDRAWPVMHEL